MVAPGPVGRSVRGQITTTVAAPGGRTLPYELDTAPFQHTAPRTVDLSLAPLGTVGVEVRSSNGVAVDHPWVEVIGDLSTKSGSTSDGLAVTSYLNRNGSGAVIQCYPPYDGSCLLPVISGGSSGKLQVVPPLPAQYFPAAPTVPGQPRVLQLTDYALASSAGSRPGTVTAGVDQGDVPELDTIPVTLPDGLDPVVGRIDYRVTLAPGASRALFTVNLPSKNENTDTYALFRQQPDGSLVLFETGGGDSPLFDVVDGSADDADGVVNGSVSGDVIPVVMAPPTITTTQLPSAAPQKAYSVQLQGTGPGAPMVWSADPNFPLPAGLTLSPDGTLSGTAPALGTYTFRVLMRDSRGWQGPATQQLTLHVEKVAVLTSSLPDGYIGGKYSGQVTFASGSLPSWSVVSGSLPPGLKLAASNGAITGTPTTAGTYAFDVVVKANGNTSQRRTLSITVHPMEIATTSLPDAPIWATYAQKLTTRGGKATLVWSVAGGSLPPGVMLSSAGALSGKPTETGSFPVTVKVTDALGQVATRSFVVTVTPMTITTASLPNVKKGGYYSQALAASGGKATLTWSLASGALPTGLTLSTAGRITGYPKAPGTWTFTVRVVDSASPRSTATRTLAITVT
ncbi:MAG: Ig family protein [Marmoricola sp.]|nr:Ig family protein [Marmoricola sp.]